MHLLSINDPRRRRLQKHLDGNYSLSKLCIANMRRFRPVPVRRIKYVATKHIDQNFSEAVIYSLALKISKV